MSSSATVLSFKNHVHPHELTREMRENICRNLNIDYVVWTCFLALVAAIVVAAVGLVSHHNAALIWHLGTIIALALWAELICFFFYDKRKRFVRESAAATAVVIRERGLHGLAPNAPAIRVRYVPGVQGELAAELYQRQPAYEFWAPLDGLSAAFERNLHVGDLITILYDPDHPSHIRIVEIEH